MSASFSTRLHNRIYLNRYRNRNMNFLARLVRFFVRLFLILLAIGLFFLINNYQVRGALELLRAPTIPPLQTLNEEGNWIRQVHLDQNWEFTVDEAGPSTREYHYTSQGTSFPIPYEWFMALEVPDSSLWSTLLKSLFFVPSADISNDLYLLRFGFIRGDDDPVHNPDKLPLGFAKTTFQVLPGYSMRTDTLGLTCAGCHTGHFIADYDGEPAEYIIEGGPATTDLEQLTLAISASLGQTAVSSYIPLFDGRFDRFAKKVLGQEYSNATKAVLQQELVNVIEVQINMLDTIETQEGFGRLDAVNRIGNQVFWKNVDREENEQKLTAPVNYPHLWTTSWFDWVQYDASVMGPMIRNAGEALGVSAQISMNAPEDEGRFDSAVQVYNLLWIEEFLKGEAFNDGLRSPPWGLDGALDPELVAQGRALYQQKCQHCHLPVIGDPDLNPHIKPIKYFNLTDTDDDSSRTPSLEPAETDESVLHVSIVPHSIVGTDPERIAALEERTIDTAGNDPGNILGSQPTSGTGSAPTPYSADGMGISTPLGIFEVIEPTPATRGMGLNEKLCSQDVEQAFKLRMQSDGIEGPAPDGDDIKLINGLLIEDSPRLNFGLALGALVQQTINEWFAENFVTDEELKDTFLGGRPNCLQVGQGYKARPLNGVWATAPFLHNGSVATLRDLLCTPQQTRPKFIQLGHLEFDEENVGIKQATDFTTRAEMWTKAGRHYTPEGYFILDTSIKGNSNQGHSFSAPAGSTFPYPGTGVIGTVFNEENNECDAILAYLKSI